MHLLLVYRDIAIGGVQKSMLRLADYTLRRGGQVSLAIAVDTAEEFVIPDNLRLVRLNETHPALLIRSLAKLIKEIEPDIVYSAMPNYNVISVIAAGLSRTSAKVIVSEHSHTRREFKEARWGLFKASIALSPIVYRFADLIIAVSDETANSLSRFSGIRRDRIKVLHNPVVGPQLLESAEAPLDDAWLRPDLKLLVSAGRLVPQKDFPTLLRTLRVLKDRRPDVRLVILGEGPDRDALKSLIDELGIDDVVRLQGFEPNPYRWMKKADLFVLSSLWEGLPTVIIEALACGATIVATDGASGPRQILGDTFGFLVPVQDPGKLADGIEHALENKLDPAYLMQESMRYSEAACFSAFHNLIGTLHQSAA